MTAAMVESTSGTNAVLRGSVTTDRFSFWYGEKQALHEITMTVAPRGVTAIPGNIR